MDGEGHLGAAGYRGADGVGVFRGDLAVVGDGEDVIALFVFADAENLRHEAGTDRVCLADVGVNGHLHSADITRG
jgi:hypothetical protein